MAFLKALSAPAQSHSYQNFSNASESRIAPNRDLQLGNASSQTAPAANPTSQREFWNALAFIALVLLIVEWWIYQRGLPQIGRLA